MPPRRAIWVSERGDEARNINPPVVIAAALLYVLMQHAAASQLCQHRPTPLLLRHSDLDLAMPPSIEPASASFLSVALILHCRHHTWARRINRSLNLVPSEMTRCCHGSSVYLKEGKGLSVVVSFSSSSFS
ncbi:hypothetical protein LINPERHAP2_LOCUS38301 [Linum perenne]